MGTITRSFANNITTSGVLLPASLNNNSIANVTAYNASVATGNMVLISSQTASNSASVSFTSGIDSTYKEYQFYFYGMQSVGASSGDFVFNLSTNAGSTYAVTKTTTMFQKYYEMSGVRSLAYVGSYDLAQSTSDQPLAFGLGFGSGSNFFTSGYLNLYNPASTTYVKHFTANTQSYANGGSGENKNAFSAGYGNTTTAINAIQFKYSNANLNGTVMMYGIK